MSDQFSSNAPIMQGGSPESFFQTWIKALTKPNEATYAEIANSPNAKASTAYKWVFAASVVASFFSIIAQEILMRGQLGQLGGGRFSNGIGTILITVICGTPILAAIQTGIFALMVAIVQWIAKLFGGSGTYDKMVYVYAAISAPFSLVAGIVSLFSAIPFVGICFSVILLLASFYVVVLVIMAVKSVNQFGWGQAAGSVLIPAAVILLFCCCLAFGVSAIMGTAISNIFNQINQSLAP